MSEVFLGIPPYRFTLFFIKDVILLWFVPPCMVQLHKYIFKYKALNFTCNIFYFYLNRMTTGQSKYFNYIRTIWLTQWS